MKIIFDCYLRFSEGYGYAAIQLALALASLPEVELYILKTPKHILKKVPDPLKGKLIDIGAKDIEDAVTIAFRTPPPYKENTWPKNLIWYTSWESTHIPKEWSDILNYNIDLLMVPSKRQIEIFRKGGIKTNSAVIPHGINQKDYHWISRTPQDIYVFGFYATYLDHRKGVDILYRAFIREFPLQEYPHVRLWFKGRGLFNWPLNFGGTFDDPRVTINTKTSSLVENLQFLKQINCFVFPTRGEGFGLPPLEAMATGLPVIATNWGGPEDYMNIQHSYPLQYRMKKVDLPSRNPNYRYTGFWAEPNINHLQSLMRNCYERRQDAEMKGRRAAKYVLDNWTWETAANDIIKQVASTFPSICTIKSPKN